MSTDTPTTPATSGFVSRWSQRKLQHAEEPDLSDLDLDQNNNETETTEPETEEQRLEKLNTLTDEDMPDVETLNENSDYSGFMSKNVSDALRKIALQKLFHGKSYNVRDGLDEYDGNYTSFEKLDSSVITCDMKHILQVEAEKLLLAEKEKENEAQNKTNTEPLVQLEADSEQHDTQQIESKNMSEEIADLDNGLLADKTSAKGENI